jgi:hypothetical protein
MLRPWVLSPAIRVLAACNSDLGGLVLDVLPSPCSSVSLLLLVLGRAVLQIDMFDEDLGSRKDDLGSTSVPLSSLKPGATTELTLPLTGECTTCSQQHPSSMP